ncbi:SDR family oxidoreductase [Aestuariirhabdus litorea]|uniref:SDR family oxidoreductase n=1 Tax=Aestuariirhabdus litorea TaxID=2528527 RepID=A0A3P3VMW1_9GAMM|nr:SDR family oxidoreductase [Aestuariirhabdus litorea]RRJ84025.1 SDR family oxidoreductase [Aestuariirhabdus litorea]RWW97245.1 SDR family oxidoreductase [Endozoicomonadaceae bacterium GTF-13]
MKIKEMQVLLTGATGGIGRETALQLASAGARVLALGRNEQELRELLVELPQLNPLPHRYLCLDICEAQQRQDLIDQLGVIGAQPSVLINMAGLCELALFEEQSESCVERIINTNVTATLLLTQSLLPLLRQAPEAHIVNVGSIFGSIGYPGYVAYSTSKFALRGFSQALQRELADSSVRVQYFAPRATATALNSDAATRLNEELGNRVDSPQRVAQELVELLREGKHTTRYLGWPERFFVRFNDLFPSLVGGSIQRQLGIIRQFAGSK